MILPKPAVFGTHDQSTLAQLQDVASRAEAAALMADGHKGTSCRSAVWRPIETR